MTPPEIQIIDAEAHHMPAVQSIYGHYVLSDLCTFEEEVPSIEQMQSRRVDVLRLGLPFMVALAGDDVVGYAYAIAYRPRASYRHTVENSVYVRTGMHGHGIGKLLLAELIDRCSRCGKAQMVAVIGNSANAGSVRIHEALGFQHVGVLSNVGFKFEQWVDTVLMQRAL
jgi:L-amino acid N-acyltransferase YncA